MKHFKYYARGNIYDTLIVFRSGTDGVADRNV
jgi:hypothetical protein